MQETVSGENSHTDPLVDLAVKEGFGNSPDAQTGEQDLVRQRERAVNLAPLHSHLSLVSRVNPDVSLNAFFTVCVQEGIGRTCDK